MFRFLAYCAIFFSLAACQTIDQPKFVMLEKADSSYQQLDFPFQTNVAGKFNVPVKFRVFDSDGKLGVCAYYTNTKTSCDGIIVDTWFDAAYLEVDGKPAGSMSHLDNVHLNPGQKYGTASCVQFKTPFKKEYKDNPFRYLRFKGRRVSASCG
ncbi:MAG: hypothetical protein OQJ97_03670 [Rhodospirillales bacterium]|nr:hypothetical protein [Rhodospirillales bacterium]